MPEKSRDFDPRDRNTDPREQPAAEYPPPIWHEGPGDKLVPERRRRAPFLLPLTCLFAILALLGAGIAIGLIVTRIEHGGSAQGTPPQASSSGCQSASPVQAQAAGTQITSVSFSGGSGNYSLTISGKGFGNAPFPSMPYNGDSPDFRIADKAQLGFGEHGYSGDALTLNYESWSDTQIQVSGLSAAQGDALEIGLWNKATNAAASWGGDIPPAQSVPKISSVSFSGCDRNLKMVIRGSGFGNTPIAMPYNGTINYFDFADYREHCGGSTAFEAGSARWGHGPDSVALVYQSWTDNEIIISGFGQPYGQGCVSAEPGDPFTITIWASTDTGQTGPQTAWGGFLP